VQSPRQGQSGPAENGVPVYSYADKNRPVTYLNQENRAAFPKKDNVLMQSYPADIRTTA
jgi:hypothetical protein